MSEQECYDNRTVIAQIVRIKERLKVLENNMDPTIRDDLTAVQEAVAALEASLTGEGGLEDRMTDAENGIADNAAAIATKADATATATEIATIVADLATKATTADVTQALAGISADLTALAGVVDTKAPSAALSDGSVTKVGTADVGSDKRFMYLDDGVPTVAGTDIGSTSKPVYYKGSSTTGFAAVSNIALGSSDSKYGYLGNGELTVSSKGGSSTSRYSLKCGNYQGTNGGVIIEAYSTNSSTASNRLGHGLKIVYNSGYNSNMDVQDEAALVITTDQVAIIPRHHVNYVTVTPTTATHWTGRLKPNTYVMRRICIVTADGGYAELVIGTGDVPTVAVIANALNVKAVSAYQQGAELWNGIYFQVPTTSAVNVYVKENIGLPNKEPEIGRAHV